MGHKSMVSGHLKHIGISRVDGLSTEPWIWGVTISLSFQKKKKKKNIKVYKKKSEQPFFFLI